MPLKTVTCKVLRKDGMNGVSLDPDVFPIATLPEGLAKQMESHGMVEIVSQEMQNNLGPVNGPAGIGLVKLPCGDSHHG